MYGCRSHNYGDRCTYTEFQRGTETQDISGLERWAELCVCVCWYIHFLPELLSLSFSLSLFSGVWFGKRTHTHTSTHLFSFLSKKKDLNPASSLPLDVKQDKRRWERKKRNVMYIYRMYIIDIRKIYRGEKAI